MINLDVQGFCLALDDSILVIDKPAGISVLPDGWEPDSIHLVRLVEEKYGRVWVVHRLDKTTSGVLVFARSAEAHRSLSLQFEQHEVRKIYHALCSGEPGWDEHTARHPLRVDVGHKHRTVVDSRAGAASETTFKVLERFSRAFLLEAAPATGKTHQIRVHCAALGFPLLGDKLYGAPMTDIIGRPALHALSLTFRHPLSGEMVSYQAPYPADILSSLKKLRAGH